MYFIQWYKYSSPSTSTEYYVCTNHTPVYQVQYNWNPDTVGSSNQYLCTIVPSTVVLQYELTWNRTTMYMYQSRTTLMLRGTSIQYSS